MFFEVGFELGDYKEISRSQVRAVRRVGKRCDIILSQKFPHIVRFFGTSFAQIFLMCRSSVIIRWTSVFGSPTSSAINRTFKRQSLSRTAFTRATLFSVLEVEGRPARCSSSTLSLPSLNALRHLKTWAEDKTASP